MTCSRIVIVFALLFATHSAFGQAEIYLNGHGAALVQVSTFDSDLAVFAGAGAVLTINRDFFVGVYGVGLVNSVTRKDPTGEEQRLLFNHGGIWAGYGFFGDSRFQLVTSGMFGFGGVKASDIDFNDRVFVFSPMLGVQTRITDWFKIELQGGYRLMSKINENKFELFSNRNLSAPFAGLALKFGGFDQ